jgi:hypothetical protein
MEGYFLPNMGLNAVVGFKTVTFVDAPQNLDLPHVATGHWDPFFTACEETQTVISNHIGASNGHRGSSPYLEMETQDLTQTPQLRMMSAISTASTCLTGWSCTVNWMWGGVFTRFPKASGGALGIWGRMAAGANRPLGLHDRPCRARVRQGVARSRSASLRDAAAKLRVLRLR